MENNFANFYKNAPQGVKNFLNSLDFYNFILDIAEKFELSSDLEINFAYLLQDLSVKLIEYKDQNELKELIKSRLNIDDTKASQLAYHISLKFIPLLKKVWQEKESSTEKEEKIKLLGKIIKQEAEIPKKGPILNLKKIIPPQKEAKSPINLQEISSEKTTVSWEPPKPKEEISKNVVIIKKLEEKRDKDKKVIDLSNF